MTKRILVVEDTEDNRQIIRDLMTSAGYELIEAVDGTVHYERAKPFLEAGLPCFIDKPFTCSVADAKKIIALAEQKKVPIFSSSSLRYAPIWRHWPEMCRISVPWRPPTSASTAPVCGSIATSAT